MTAQFQRDDEWSRKMRDRILVESFYGRYATDGRYVLLDKGRLASLLQRRFQVDTIMQGKGGTVVGIEEKIVRWNPKYSTPYTRFALETMSCTVPGRESDGWMKYGQADYLLYCFSNAAEDELDCHLIDFQRLKEWFWPRIARWKPSRTEQINQSECRLVPILEVRSGVPSWRFKADGTPVIHRPLPPTNSA